jgi:dipeptidyl aminopeptidase/acylaminoacyl peptidase
MRPSRRAGREGRAGARRILILHSEDDLRCPIGNAEDVFAILRLLKRKVEFVRFPAESHELSRSGCRHTD